MNTTDEAWREWGKRDPYFAVITNPKFRQAQLGPDTKREFFESGTRHVEHLTWMVKRLLVEQKFQPRRALDFGCGVGRIVIPLARISGEVVGVDISENMLSEARANCIHEGISNASFELSDDTLSRVSGTFDFVHSFIVLQHIDVERGRAFFQRLLDLTAPNGIAAIHLTYAKAVHADRYGRPPESGPFSLIAPSTPTGSVLRDFGRRLGLKRDRSHPEPQHEGDPQMQMNCYPMNDLLFLVQRSRVRVAHIEFTDHGGELGVFMFLRKPQAKLP